jgi:hypothetical protein
LFHTSLKQSVAVAAQDLTPCFPVIREPLQHTFVGLGVHKETISVAYVAEQCNAEVVSLGSICTLAIQN